jgi:hypothetical protein
MAAPGQNGHSAVHALPSATPEENDMLLQIIVHTPAWVWFLLLALLALGASQMRDREVHPAWLLVLPLVLLGLGLTAMRAGLAALPGAAMGWSAAVLALAFVGRRLPLPTGARWLGAQRRLHLPGSALPLLLIVSVFLMRYTLGAAQAVHPAWRHAPEVVWPTALLYGSISGLLLGRAWALFRLTRPVQAEPLPHPGPAARA